MSTTVINEDIASLMGELAAPAGQADPYPIYRRMHALGEAVEAPDGTVVVTGYRASSAVIRDNRLRKSPGSVLTAAGYPDWEARPSLRMLFGSMLMLNPPNHTRVRRLVSRSFTAHRVAAMREAITRLARELCDPLSGTIEFVDAVSFPFPVTVIGELLGIPPADRAMFQPLVREWTSVLEILNPLAVDSADAAAMQIQSYLRDLVRVRRERPADDLISALVAVEDDEHQLTEAELVTMAALILAAGFETTTGLLANGFLTLLDTRARPVGCGASLGWPNPRSRSCCATTRPCRSSTAAPPPRTWSSADYWSGTRAAPDQPAGRRQPRPAPVLRTRRAAPGSRRGAWPFLRRGHPPLPWRRAGSPRGPGDAAHAPGALSEGRSGGCARAAQRSHAARVHVVARRARRLTVPARPGIHRACNAEAMTVTAGEHDRDIVPTSSPRRTLPPAARQDPPSTGHAGRRQIPAWRLAFCQRLSSDRPTAHPSVARPPEGGDGSVDPPTAHPRCAIRRASDDSAPLHALRRSLRRRRLQGGRSASPRLVSQRPPSS